MFAVTVMLQEMNSLTGTLFIMYAIIKWSFIGAMVTPSDVEIRNDTWEIAMLFSHTNKTPR